MHTEHNQPENSANLVQAIETLCERLSDTNRTLENGFDEIAHVIGNCGDLAARIAIKAGLIPSFLDNFKPSVYKSKD